MIAALEGTTMDGSTPQLVRCRGTLPDGKPCDTVIARRWVGRVESVFPTYAERDDRGRIRNRTQCPICHKASYLPLPRLEAA